MPNPTFKSSRRRARAKRKKAILGSSGESFSKIKTLWDKLKTKPIKKMKTVAQSWITRQLAKLISIGLTTLGGVELASAQESNTAATATLVSGIVVMLAEMAWSKWQRSKLEKQHP